MTVMIMYKHDQEYPCDINATRSIAYKDRYKISPNDFSVMQNSSIPWYIEWQLKINSNIPRAYIH